jgi:hypothetical protein
MYKSPITEDMSELEKFVRQEADNYVNTTCFLSCISDHHPNIDSVVEKGKEVTPYVVKLYKEYGENSSQNMYTHFFLIVMQRLYGNPFEGYVGMEFCVRYWLKAYKHGVLEDIFKDNRNETNKKKSIAFLCDLFETNEEGLKQIAREHERNNYNTQKD